MVRWWERRQLGKFWVSWGKHLHRRWVLGQAVHVQHYVQQNIVCTPPLSSLHLQSILTEPNTKKTPLILKHANSSTNSLFLITFHWKTFLLTAQRQVQESFEHEGKHLRKLDTGSLPDNSSVNFPKLRAILLAQACLPFSLLILLWFQCVFYCVILKSIFLCISLRVISMGIYYLIPVWFHCVFGCVISAHISLCVIWLCNFSAYFTVCDFHGYFSACDFIVYFTVCNFLEYFTVYFTVCAFTVCDLSVYSTVCDFSVYSTVPGSASCCAEPVVATSAYCWRGNLSSSSESEWCTLPSGVVLSLQWRVELCGWALLSLQKLWSVDTVLWLCPSQLWNIKMALIAAPLNAEVIMVVTV